MTKRVPPRDRQMHLAGLEFPIPLWRALRVACAEDGCTVSSVVRALVASHLQMRAGRRRKAARA